MRRRAIPFIALAVLFFGGFFAGCASRGNNLYVFSKSGITQMQVMEDADKLRGTRGVDKVLWHVDSLGNAQVQVYLDEENELPGLRHVTEGLGYQLITP